VLTNNPPFDVQLEKLNKYSFLTAGVGEGTDEKAIGYSTASYGLGAMGLPGDFSSSSRFVRADFVRKNSVTNSDELSSVGQFFHIMSSVGVVKGACKDGEGRDHFTVYTSCMNTDKGRYYYTTYGNRRISCVDMHRCSLDGEALQRFSLLDNQDVFFQV